MLESVRRIGRSEILIDLNVGHIERTAVNQRHPLMVVVGANLLHRLSQINPIDLTELTEGRGRNHVALGQARLVKSRTHALNVVEDGLFGFSHIGDGITSGSEDKLTIRDHVGIHHLDLSVKYAASQIDISAIVATRGAFALLPHKYTRRDVAVGFDSCTNRVPNGTGDRAVVGGIAEDIIGRNGNGHAEPYTCGVTNTQRDAVDFQLDEDCVALLKLTRSNNTVVLVSARVKSDLNDVRGNADAGYAQVAHTGLLEEGLHSVIRIELSTGSRQLTDQVLVLIQASHKDGAVEWERSHRGFLRGFYQHVDCVEAGHGSARGDRGFVDKSTGRATTGTAK